MGRATTFIRALSFGGTLSLILLAIAFQTTGTREAEAQTQTTLTETLVQGSPWKGHHTGKRGDQKVDLIFFSGKDGKFTATFNKQPTLRLIVDGKEVTLTAKKKGGKILEFLLKLNNEGLLSGTVEYSGNEKYVILKPAR